MPSLPASRSVALLAAAITLTSTVACGDKSSTGPDPAAAATQAADRFDDVADSLANAGDDFGSGVAQALAELIRTSGRVDRVVVKLNGRSVTHTTLALETLVPESACASTSDPVTCRSDNPPFNQVVLGWTGTDFKESFVMTSEQPGTATVAYDDYAIDYPPGELLYFQRDVNAEGTDLFGAPAREWLGDDGSVTTSLGVRGAACELPEGAQPGLGFTCNVAHFTPSFDVIASRLDTDVSTSSLHLTMAAQRVDGLSVTVTQAEDPSVVFSLGRTQATTQRRVRAARVHELLRRVAPVFGRARVPR